VVLIVAANDKAVPPADAPEVARRLPNARIETIPAAGHLAHEERAAEIAALIRRVAQEHISLASD